MRNVKKNTVFLKRINKKIKVQEQIKVRFINYKNGAYVLYYKISQHLFTKVFKKKSSSLKL